MSVDVEGLFEPCGGEVEFTEKVTTFGVPILVQACTCGKDLGSASMVESREDAMTDLAEWRFCHERGVEYNAYMGFRRDGSEMTDEEYAHVTERMEQ